MKMQKYKNLYQNIIEVDKSNNNIHMHACVCLHLCTFLIILKLFKKPHYLWPTINMSVYMNLLK